MSPSVALASRNKGTKDPELGWPRAPGAPSLTGRLSQSSSFFRAAAPYAQPPRPGQGTRLGKHPLLQRAGSRGGACLGWGGSVAQGRGEKGWTEECGGAGLLFRAAPHSLCACRHLPAPELSPRQPALQGWGRDTPLSKLFCPTCPGLVWAPARHQEDLMGEGEEKWGE